MAAKKDVLLVGLGAVGAIYSFILTRSGLATVTCVARSNYDLVKERGVDIRSRKYGNVTGWKPDRLCSSVSDAADRAYAYVILTTKSIPELVKTSEVLAPFLERAYIDKFPQPVYVLMQNGLNVEVEFYEALIRAGNNEPRIISTALWIGTNLLDGNRVEHNDLDRIAIGVYRHNDIETVVNSPEESGLLSDFCGMVGGSGSDACVVGEIQRVKFRKNFWNIAFGAYATLTGHTLPAIFRPPPDENGPKYSPYVSPVTADLVASETMPSIRAILQELLSLGRAMNLPETDLPASVVEDTIKGTARFHSTPDSAHRPSMFLDSQLGRPIEVELVFGEVVRMARKYRVDMPRVDTLYALLVVVQNQIFRRMEEERAQPSVGRATAEHNCCN